MSPGTEHERKPVAYAIADVEEILDENVAKRYSKLSPPVILKYGGRFLTGDQLVAKEGRSGRGYVVIVEFPSMKQALAWYNSSEYAPIRALAPIAYKRRLLFVSGAAHEPTSK